ncbi:MAG: hypothetical protein BGN83_06750 [Rhizobium sp. 63-7]|nr:MAG: hypothetical protein BGN83_06750 [Rhizobium sp. 63-7]
MTYLLDVNILIPLLDSSHIHHTAAFGWFSAIGGKDWASCPLTENGLLRIMSNPRYPNWAGKPVEIAALFNYMRQMTEHRFWGDEISLLDPGIFDIEEIRKPGAITDVYLLGLARFKNGKLATFDRRINANAVIGGHEALHVIDT